MVEILSHEAEARAWIAARTLRPNALERLSTYAEMLARWQQAVNLVSRTTLDQIWVRHFLDSAQVFDLLPGPDGPLVDLGSGAGFPGLVLAILGVRNVHLVESDQKKAAFLREAARVTLTDCHIHALRVEEMPPFDAAIITARGLAPLARLLAHAAPFRGPNTAHLFLKGRGHGAELAEARQDWRMKVQKIPSLTDPDAAILQITEVAEMAEENA